MPTFMIVRSNPQLFDISAVLIIDLALPGMVILPNAQFSWSFIYVVRRHKMTFWSGVGLTVKVAALGSWGSGFKPLLGC